MFNDKILIIGGLGYIGTFLCQELDYDITVVDLNIFNYSTTKKCEIKDYKKLSKSFLKQFDTIILLAGHSSVRMCDCHSKSVFKNNVQNFIELTEKISNKQKFIYASSASVYGDSSKDVVSEEEPLSNPYNMYDFTKQAIDSYISINKFSFPVFGLRFGTVNGASPHLRNDVMLNAMTYNALKNKEILLYNPNTRRSILGIKDLKNAISTILTTNIPKSGIYNLSSFTKTAKEMADTAGKILNVPVKIVIPDDTNIKNVNEKLISSKYNFGLNCNSFCDNFNFSFKDTINSIVDDLVVNWDKMSISNRNSPFNYKD